MPKMQTTARKDGQHTTIAQQESGRILSSIWRQVVGAIPIGGPRQLKRMFAQEPILNPSLLTAGKTAPDRRVIRHQLHRPHLSTMCPRAAIKAAIPRRQTGNEKRPAPGLFQELFWYQGLSVMCNVDFSAVCRTAEKLTPRICIFYPSFYAHERR